MSFDSLIEMKEGYVALSIFLFKWHLRDEKPTSKDFSK